MLLICFLIDKKKRSPKKVVTEPGKYLLSRYVHNCSTNLIFLIFFLLYYQEQSHNIEQPTGIDTSTLSEAAPLNTDPTSQSEGYIPRRQTYS